ncbi:MAG: DUF370 domain-containing protein [Oscillospiraceae bacterium]|nr:DUF370 domain-containing protein [Oscillospiraceae bacterium]
MQFANVGFGNLVSVSRILAILDVESQPVKRLGQEAKAAGLLIDATQGRRTKSVLLLDSGHVVWSYLVPETLAKHLGFDSTKEDEGEKR